MTVGLHDSEVNVGQFSFEMVAYKKKCKGNEVDMGRFLHIEDCARSCRKLSSMFKFGTNDYDSKQCDVVYVTRDSVRYEAVKQCSCKCETAATSDGQCNLKIDDGFRLFRFKKGKNISIEISI